MNKAREVCSMMVDRDKLCEQPVAGWLALASDESQAKPMPFCREHLKAVEADNARYEQKLHAFVV